jgi:methylphosphotriester-DNA--protein-cysteine methyltransferase
MPNYPVQTIASAPEGSKPALEQLKKAFGVVPNIVGAIANSRKLINSLVGVSPHKYMMMRRIERAKELLKRSSMSVLE